VVALNVRSGRKGKRFKRGSPSRLDFEVKVEGKVEVAVVEVSLSRPELAVNVVTQVGSLRDRRERMRLTQGECAVVVVYAPPWFGLGSVGAGK
jgi:hypothetical protein